MEPGKLSQSRGRLSSQHARSPPPRLLQTRKVRGECTGQLSSLPLQSLGAQNTERTIRYAHTANEIREYDSGDKEALCLQEGNLPSWGNIVLGTLLRTHTCAGMRRDEGRD